MLCCLSTHGKQSLGNQHPQKAWLAFGSKWQRWIVLFLHHNLKFLLMQGKENILNSSYGNTPAAALNFVKAFLIVFHNTPSQCGCCFTLASTGKLKFKCSTFRFGK